MQTEHSREHKENNRCMPLTTRIDVNLGYACNNDCVFCYFKERKRAESNLSTSEAKQLLFRIKSFGIDTVELTGGEVTLRKDILEIIAFAKENLNFNHISVITNGSGFCNAPFAARALECGVDDVLVSIHGPDEHVHDALVNRNGSFQEAVQSIENLLRLGASCRTNTVVNQKNVQHLSEIGALLHTLSVQQVNYIFFSPLDDARQTRMQLWPRYSEAAPHVGTMIDRYRKAFKTISIKAIPFCFLGGYADFITNFHQNIYDPFEWDNFNRVRIRRGLAVRNLATLTGMLFLMDIRRMRRISYRRSLYEATQRMHARIQCVKPRVCRQCMFDSICPGLWKSYAKKFGVNEVKPVFGTKIRDLDYPVRNRFASYYSD
jgi:organic radical activating enzyme